jgi:hypothetical protein
MFNIDSYFSVCLGLQAKTLKVDHKALRGQVLVIVFFHVTSKQSYIGSSHRKTIF